MTIPVYDLNAVVRNGTCVGCGACAASTASIQMKWTELETYVPDISRASNDEIRVASQVCPFSSQAKNEDQLAEQLWGKSTLSRSPELGYHLTIGTGRITDDAAVTGSSSGGLTTLILRKLLARGEIDGVIHAADSGNGDPLVFYRVSESLDELLSGRKSKYHSVEFSQAIRSIRGNGKRYALVGVPCFIKAGRLLADKDRSLSQQLPYFIGLVCGHMKSGAFAKSFAWQMGIPPDRLAAFDFRVKDPTRGANSYSVSASEVNSGHTETRPSQELLGSDWGHVMFRLKSCDFCDDIAGEVADICLGDAWLPQYQNDWRGTNIYVNRQPLLQELLDQAARDGEVVLHTASESDFVRSQDGNYRHRREGLAIRIGDLERRNKPRPIKRYGARNVSPGWIRAHIYRTRVRLGDSSHALFLEARREKDLSIFRMGMERLLKSYRNLYRLLRLRDPTYILTALRARLRL